MNKIAASNITQWLANCNRSGKDIVAVSGLKQQGLLTVTGAQDNGQWDMQIPGLPLEHEADHYTCGPAIQLYRAVYTMRHLEG